LAQARQHVDGAHERAADGGAADRHVRGREIAPEQLHRIVVGGGRIGQGFAREGDQPHAVARQAIHQALELALGPLQARGIDVLGQHRLGEIERDDDVDPALLFQARAPSCLRSRQGQAQSPRQSTQQRRAGHLARHRGAADMRAMSTGLPSRRSARRRAAKAMP
jgi:hypothetical protein